MIFPYNPIQFHQKFEIEQKRSNFYYKGSGKK